MSRKLEPRTEPRYSFVEYEYPQSSAKNPPFGRYYCPNKNSQSTLASNRSLVRDLYLILFASNSLLTSKLQIKTLDNNRKALQILPTMRRMFHRKTNYGRHLQPFASVVNTDLMEQEQEPGGDS